VNITLPFDNSSRNDTSSGSSGDPTQGGTGNARASNQTSSDHVDPNGSHTEVVGRLPDGAQTGQRLSGVYVLALVAAACMML
jgi:hypothetical protein